ncbi:hypothetical protein Tco_0889433 [Tanacetum coccineum]
MGFPRRSNHVFFEHGGKVSEVLVSDSDSVRYMLVLAWMGRCVDIEGLGLGEQFTFDKDLKLVMEALLTPDWVFDFPMAELEPHLAYDFFAAEPIPGIAEAPGNRNGWIEKDVPLGGEIGEPMEIAGGPRGRRMVLSFTYEVGGPSTTTSGTLLPVGQPFPCMTRGTSMVASVVDDLYVRMSNLEYGHGALVKKKGTRVELLNLQLQTRLTEMEIREGTLITYIRWMEECLAILEGRLPRSPSGPQLSCCLFMTLSVD